MLKYISKIFIIICLLMIVSLNLFAVNAEPSEDSETSTEEVSDTNDSETSTEDITDDTVIEEEISDEESTDDIYTEETEPIGQVQQSSTDNMDITSIKTVNGLPEANLKLNNILNIILIAIGVLLILLSIALLIRIKK